MDIGGFLGIMKMILIICAVGSVVVGIVKLATAAKKGRGRWYKIKTIVFSILSAALFLFMNSLLVEELDNSGNYIKAQHPVGVPNITYGQAIDKVCGNQRWSRAGNENTTTGQTIVHLDADCMYGGEEHKITIQFSYGARDFVLIDEDTPFEITFIGFDDAEETSISDMQDIMFEMFEHYATSNGIPLDPSARDTILYSEGSIIGNASTGMDNEILTANSNTANDTMNQNLADSMEIISETSTEYMSTEELVYPPEGWLDPNEEIDVMEIAGSYTGLLEASNASLSIYSGPTEEETAAGEVGNASIYIGSPSQVFEGVSFEGLLVTLGNNTYALMDDTGQDVLLQVYYFRNYYFDLYINGEYIDTYSMVEQYIS